jgi:hypothetical protein
MTALEITKRYQLLYRLDDGSATYKCVNTKAISELLHVASDGSMFTSLIGGPEEPVTAPVTAPEPVAMQRTR